MPKQAMNMLQDEVLEKLVAGALTSIGQSADLSLAERAVFREFLAYWCAKKEEHPELWGLQKLNTLNQEYDVKVFARNLGFKIFHGSRENSRSSRRRIRIPYSFSANEVKVATAKALARQILAPYFHPQKSPSPLKMEGADYQLPSEAISNAVAAALLFSPTYDTPLTDLAVGLPKPYKMKWALALKESSEFDGSKLEAIN